MRNLTIQHLDGNNYIGTYLIADQATYTLSQWNLSSAFKAIGSGTYHEWAQGMINVQDSAGVTHEILREEEQLKMKTLGWTTHEFYFDLSSWTARYGKPVELMLALHLSTMMPDLTYEIATNQAFNTKVNIVGSEVTVTYKVLYKGKEISIDIINKNKEKIASNKKENGTMNSEDNQIWTGSQWIEKGNSDASGGTVVPPMQGSPGGVAAKKNVMEGTDFPELTENEFNGLAELVNKGIKGKIQTDWPRIDSVTNHWFYNDFEFQYGTSTLDSSEGIIDYTPKEGSALSNIASDIKLDTSISGTSYYQICDPAVTGPNETIKKLFLGGKGELPNGANYNFSGKCYQFDGTTTTAQEIYNAKAKEAGKSHYDFGGQTQIPVKKDIKVEKKPVNFNVETTLEDGTKISGKKNAFTAFSILEGMHTEASKQTYRCLKDLLVSLGYFTEDDFQVPSTQVLEWPIKEFTPAIWPKRDANQYGSSVQSKSTLDEGFESGLTVTCPGDGTITEIGSNSIKIKFKQLSNETITYLEDLYKEDNIKIDKNCILDMELIIQGINVDSSLSVNKIIKRGDTIGTTSESDILFIMYNKDKSIIDNIEDYMSPTYAPTDITIDNNYVVDTNKSAAQVTDVETFKKAFKPYPVLVENAQAFIDIQTKYHVNALFAGAVAVAESSGGTYGFLITNKTYNMFSIQGSYNGYSYISHNSKGEKIYWKMYPDFATAIDDFGKLISTSTNYIGGGNITIVDIGIKYCPPGRSWATSVSQHMTDAIERIT